MQGYNTENSDSFCKEYNMYLGKTVFAHYVLIDGIYFSSF